MTQRQPCAVAPGPDLCGGPGSTRQGSAFPCAEAAPSVRLTVPVGISGAHHSPLPTSPQAPGDVTWSWHHQGVSPDPAQDPRLLAHVRWLIERDEQAAATFSMSAGVIAAGLVAEVAILVDKGAGAALWWLALPAVPIVIAIAPRPGAVTDPAHAEAVARGEGTVPLLERDQLLNVDRGLLRAAAADRRYRGRALVASILCLFFAQIPLALTIGA